MELKLLEIHGEGRAYREDFLRLYEASFPRMERKPVTSLDKTFAEGRNRVLAVTDGGEFVGLAVVMTDGEVTLLDYLAIAGDKRNKGYGAAVLQRLLAEYADRPFLVEIERIDESAPDNAARIKRRSFYLRNGLESSGVFVWLFHMEYELLCAHGRAGYPEYRKLLTSCMGSRIKPFLRQLEA